MKVLVARMRKSVRLLDAVVAQGLSTFSLARWAIREKNAIQRTTELMGLIGLVRSLRPNVILEIGSYKGGTLVCWSRAAADDALILSLDLPDGDQLIRYGYGEGNLAGIRRFLRPEQRLETIYANSQSLATR